MLNSRDINNLRPDVAANCRVFLGLCKDAGLQVLVTATVRDEEYQRYCYDQGTANTPLPSFHGIKAGLAFDICKNVKGHEWDDLEFYRRAGELGEKLGFEWGGRWKKFIDRPHFQWSQGMKYTSAMVRDGKYPPTMPLYEEGIDMTKEEVQALVNGTVERALADRDEVIAEAAQKISPWAAEAWKRAQETGVMDGTRPGMPLTREQYALTLDRLGQLKRSV